MAYIAHYLFLFFVIINGAYYWFVFAVSLARTHIDHGFVGPGGATGIFWLLQHPIIAYLVLFLCVLLVAKEFFMSSLRKRFLWNLAFLVLVFFLYGVHAVWLIVE